MKKKYNAILKFLSKTCPENFNRFPSISKLPETAMP